MAAEQGGAAAALRTFLAGEVTSSESLIPALRAVHPHLVAEGERFAIEDASLRHALATLADVRLTESAAHVLGEAFQALLGPRIRGDRGQFFTPRSLVRAIVEILAPQPGERILDPACGTGGFLYEAEAHVQARGGAPGRLCGADKDRELARLAAALLAHRRGERTIANINSLAPDDWAAADLGDEYDVILTNPPFGAKIPLRDPTLLGAYTLAHRWHYDPALGRWTASDAPLSGQDPQVLFLELCLQKLRPGGRMAIVLPEGVFGNKNEAHVWDFVRERAELLALLDCPRTTFQPSTDVKTNVLFLRRHPARAPVKRPRRPAKRGAKAANRQTTAISTIATSAGESALPRVAVAVALHCGHDPRGRTQRSDGSPYADDFAAIGRGLCLAPGRRAIAAPWREVALRSPYYLVPRYLLEEAPLSASEAALLVGAEWATLGELRERGLVDLRKGHEVGSEAYGGGDVPFVRTSDLANFEITVDPTKSVSDEVYQQHAPQQRLRAGSILMVVDGRYRIGATAILSAQTARCVAQSHLVILDAVEPAVLGPFALLFALSLPAVRQRIRDLVFVQSTLGTLGPRLLELRVPLLGGEGPWSPTLARFREAIEGRDRMLGVLGEIAGPTPML